MNRRSFLKSTLSGLALVGIGNPLVAHAAETNTLRIGTRTLEVNGRAATVYALLGPDGRPGLTLPAGARFNVALVNGLDEETMIHWHGLTPPWNQDGVPGAPSPLMRAGETRRYDFPVPDGGTHWMHAHTLQEQNLLAAPLIIGSSDDRRDEQDVVVLLHDFSFTSAAELLSRLRKPNGAAGHVGVAHGAHGAVGGVMAAAALDLNDIEYDAYLANDRTLADPEIRRVERGAAVRLRVINGATSTAFTIDLGALVGTLIAVDGMPVEPLDGRRFPLSMGQRIDVRLPIPKEGGAFPVLALREGAPERTGIVLATAGAEVRKVLDRGEPGPVVDLSLEARLRATKPLAIRRADRSVNVGLIGDMASYTWAIDGAATMRAKRGERLEITMVNKSMMAHPMHLHGHRFQVVEIGGRRIAGAVRDTVLVPPMQAVTLAVDADNPGRWAFHCHHLYHMAAGMMAEFAYSEAA
jgi:FtsP/CotA-like multicopper oxidase with cupredoxin domain